MQRLKAWPGSASGKQSTHKIYSTKRFKEAITRNLSVSKILHYIRHGNECHKQCIGRVVILVKDGDHNLYTYTTQICFWHEFATVVPPGHHWGMPFVKKWQCHENYDLHLLPSKTEVNSQILAYLQYT